MNYIKFLERFGVLISIYIFWSIIFYKFADRTQKVWADMGLLEALIYLVGVTIGNYQAFIICLILFFVLFYLRKIRKIKIDDNILILFGLSINVIISSFLVFFLTSKSKMKLDIELITLFSFVPVVHSLFAYYISSALMNKIKK
jgi:multisubunit Na+/H+ antiporter MnhF subunit